MNTQLFEDINPAACYSFVTVPQEGVKYRFENKSPYTLFITSQNVSSLDLAKTLAFATVAAGQMHEFNGRYSAPFTVYTDRQIDFGYSNQVKTSIILTTNLQGESSYTAPLPIAFRSDDSGLDNLFPTYTDFSGATVLPSIDMEGFFGLAVSWNFLGSYFYVVSVETSDDDISWQYTTSIAGQSIYQTIPKIRRYFRLTVISYGVNGGTSVVDSPLLVSRLKLPQMPQVGIVDNDNYQKVISSMALPVIYIPVQEGPQSFLLTLTGGTAKTIIRSHSKYGSVDDIDNDEWVSQGTPTYITINAPIAGVTALEVLTAEAAPRLLIVERVKQGQNDNDLIPASFTASTTGTTYTDIPLKQFETLSLAWNCQNNDFLSVDVYGATSKGGTYEFVTTVVGQSSNNLIPRQYPYYKIIATGQNDAGTANVLVRMIVGRNNESNVFVSKRQESDIINGSVAAGALTPVRFPLKRGRQVIKISSGGGGSRALYRVAGFPYTWVYIWPYTEEIIEIDCPQDTIGLFTPQSTDAAIRSIVISVWDGQRPFQNFATDVRYAVALSGTITNAAPALALVVGSTGWDWAKLSIMSSALALPREVQFVDNTGSNSDSIFIKPSDTRDLYYKLDPKKGTVNLTLTGVAIAAGETIAVRLTVIKGNELLPLMTR